MARSAKKFSKKRVTSYDVAREVGVTAMTVGLALRDDPRVFEKTKSRVRAMARQMRYRPRAAASTLAGGRTHSVGLIFARTAGVELESAMGVYAAVVKTVAHLLTERDFVMNLTEWQQPEPYEKKQPAQLPRVFRESGLEGALVIWPPVDGTLEKTLHDAMLPYVVIDGPAAPGRCAVLLNERLGMQMAVEYLIKLGHQRISVIGMQPRIDPSAHIATRHWEYQEGYIGAMHQAGLAPMPGREHEARSGKESYDQLVAGTFDAAQPPTAVIAYDDYEALEVISRLNLRSLSVPEDVSVISLRDRHDVDDTISRIKGLPQLTCKANMHEQMAAAAVDMLMTMIDNDEPIAADHTPEPTVIEPKLIVRESTGAVQNKNIG